MVYFPHLRFEKKLFKRGLSNVVGLDEAGKGAWAGPIVAGALLLRSDNLPVDKKLRKIVKDSKLLITKTREQAYNLLQENFEWAVGVINQQEIDKIGIKKANQLAMDLAIQALKIPPDYILVDGRGFKFEIDYQNIINGDYKVFCIAAASIIAKVNRDRILIQEDKNFPAYNFINNKGYGTFRHYQAICNHGICPLHRLSFKPIRDMV